MRYLALIGICVAFATGCKQSTDIQAWADRTGVLRVQAEKEATRAPFRLKQHQALKNYFSELGGMAMKLGSDDKLRTRFNEAVSKSDLAKMCRKVFVPSSVWHEVMDRCTKNRFFLCAEEVRAYPDMVRAIEAGLSASQKSRFSQTRECQEAF